MSDLVLLAGGHDAAFPGHHESGFRFRVPRSQRTTVAKAMETLGRMHGFEVDKVGFLGTIRCTYRQRNADAVMEFVARHMRKYKLTLIPDYQARYGVIED